MWGDFGGHMGWMGMGVFWLLGAVFLIALAWMVSRAAAFGPPARPADDSPETILKRRYARGELTRDQYEQQLGDLRK